MASHDDMITSCICFLMFCSVPLVLPVCCREGEVFTFDAIVVLLASCEGFCLMVSRGAWFPGREAGRLLFTLTVVRFLEFILSRWQLTNGNIRTNDKNNTSFMLLVFILFDRSTSLLYRGFCEFFLRR